MLTDRPVKPKNTCKLYKKYNYEYGGEEAVFWGIACYFKLALLLIIEQETLSPYTIFLELEECYTTDNSAVLDMFSMIVFLLGFNGFLVI